MEINPALQSRMTELSISYSAGCKGSLADNRYENATAQISRSERWNVEGLSWQEIQNLYSDRMQDMHDELGVIIEDEYREITA